MDHVTTWLQTIAVLITGGGILFKLSSVLTRLDTLLAALTDRVGAIEDYIQEARPAAKRKRIR